MNGDEPNLGDFNPSWMEDGLGISGEQGEPDFEDATQWDTYASSQQNQEQDFTGGTGDASCSPSDPPGSGTHVWGSVDGVCQWIDTTTC